MPPTETAFPTPPADCMVPASQPEAVPDGATVDEALQAAIRNAGRARLNVHKLGCLQDFSTKAGAVK